MPSACAGGSHHSPRRSGGPCRSAAGARRAIALHATVDGDALSRMLYADAHTWLADNLLERGDRMSMAASLELRPPFLDHRLVGACLLAAEQCQGPRQDDEVGRQGGRPPAPTERDRRSSEGGIQGAPGRMVPRRLARHGIRSADRAGRPSSAPTFDRSRRRQAAQDACHLGIATSNRGFGRCCRWRCGIANSFADRTFSGRELDSESHRNRRSGTLHERSRFAVRARRWFYVDGEMFS